MPERKHSYSALQTLGTCERKYALHYLEDLESDKPEKVQFLRGNSWHALVEAQMLSYGSQRGSLLNHPEKIRVFRGLDLGIDWSNPQLPTVMSPDHGPELPLNPNAVLTWIKYWWVDQESERREEIESVLGTDLHTFLYDLWARYALHWAETCATQLPLLVEYEWDRQAPNGMWLTGRVDSVLYDTERCLVIVRDSKTHDSWPSEPDAVLDLMDSQLHLQAWGLAPGLRELSDGEYVPQAVEFDRLRSKRPTNPKLTTKGILSKTVTDFDSYTYKAWCSSEDAIQAGYEYDEQVALAADANAEAWFRRSLKPLSMNAVTAHVLAAQAQAKRAAGIDAKTAGIVPSKSCGWCEYLSLCRTEIIGGRPENLIPQDYGLRVRGPRE